MMAYELKGTTLHVARPVADLIVLGPAPRLLYRRDQSDFRCSTVLRSSGWLHEIALLSV